jgi:hypothetical protein
MPFLRRLIREIGVAERIPPRLFYVALVAKPDIGWQGYGVRAIASESELRTHIAGCPRGATLILQEMIAWDGEAGVFSAFAVAGAVGTSAANCSTGWACPRQRLEVQYPSTSGTEQTHAHRA